MTREQTAALEWAISELNEIGVLGNEVRHMDELCRLRAALSAPKAEAEEPCEPLAWQYRYNGATYVTNSERQARQGLDVTPLFPLPPLREQAEPHPDDKAEEPSPVPAITDEAVERAAKAIHDGPLGASDEEDFGDNKASDWCREVARAALLAAFPSKGVGE